MSSQIKSEKQGDKSGDKVAAANKTPIKQNKWGDKYGDKAAAADKIAKTDRQTSGETMGNMSTQIMQTKKCRNKSGRQAGRQVGR